MYSSISSLTSSLWQSVWSATSASSTTDADFDDKDGSFYEDLGRSTMHLVGRRLPRRSPTIVGSSSDHDALSPARIMFHASSSSQSTPVRRPSPPTSNHQAADKRSWAHHHHQQQQQQQHGRRSRTSSHHQQILSPSPSPSTNVYTISSQQEKRDDIEEEPDVAAALLTHYDSIPILPQPIHRHHCSKQRPVMPGGSRFSSSESRHPEIFDCNNGKIVGSTVPDVPEALLEEEKEDRKTRKSEEEDRSGLSWEHPTAFAAYLYRTSTSAGTAMIRSVTGDASVFSTSYHRRRCHQQTNNINNNTDRDVTTPDSIQFHIPNSNTFPNLNATRPLRMFYPWGISSSSLGSLNPELYKCPEEGDITDYPEGHLGRIWFSVEYVQSSERLSLEITKIRNLPSRIISSNSALDPFVRVYLLPDERRHVQTKIKRKTINPNFNEHFGFDISSETFNERSLKFIVYDIDHLQRYSPIGGVDYNLTEYSQSKQQKFTTWRDLRKDIGDIVNECQIGELQCSLMYNETLERLTVTLIEAKDLKQNINASANSTPVLDTYGRVSLILGKKAMGSGLSGMGVSGWRRSSSKKTRPVRRSTCPTYNESFHFNKLPSDRLDQAAVSIQIMQVKPDRQIGRLTLGGRLYSRDKPLEHWNMMLARPKEHIVDWHFLTE